MPAAVIIDRIGGMDTAATMVAAIRPMGMAMVAAIRLMGMAMVAAIRLMGMVMVAAIQRMDMAMAMVAAIHMHMVGQS
jgi:hypothetical protein